MGTAYRVVDAEGHVIDPFVWASDYPHVDAQLGVVRELRERIARLPGTSQRRILGDNAARLYGLG